MARTEPALMLQEVHDEYTMICPGKTALDGGKRLVLGDTTLY